MALSGATPQQTLATSGDRLICQTSGRSWYAPELLCMPSAPLPLRVEPESEPATTPSDYSWGSGDLTELPFQSLALPERLFVTESYENRPFAALLASRFSKRQTPPAPRWRAMVPEHRSYWYGDTDEEDGRSEPESLSSISTKELPFQSLLLPEELYARFGLPNISSPSNSDSFVSESDPDCVDVQATESPLLNAIKLCNEMGKELLNTPPAPRVICMEPEAEPGTPSDFNGELSSGRPFESLSLPERLFEKGKMSAWDDAVKAVAPPSPGVSSGLWSEYRRKPRSKRRLPGFLASAGFNYVAALGVLLLM